MNNLPFTELCTFSNFSFLQGGSHPEELVQQAAKLGYSSLALADLHSLSGIVRAHTAAKAQGIKLIIASQIRLYQTLPKKIGDEELTPQELTREFETNCFPFSLFLYPTNRKSYGRLCQLLTRGKLRAPKGACWLQISDLKDFSADLFAVMLPFSLCS